MFSGDREQVWPRLRKIGSSHLRKLSFNVEKECDLLAKHGLSPEIVSFDPEDWVPEPILRGEMS